MPSWLQASAVEQTFPSIACAGPRASETGWRLMLRAGVDDREGSRHRGEPNTGWDGLLECVV